jgi:Fe2+ or Zn2+ uptake regulation protein
MKMRLNLNNGNEMKAHSRTRQRRLLLDIIRGVEGHIDARELFRRAAEKDDAISNATVYRSLNLFKQLGLIQENRLGKVQCYYEAKRPAEHQHLVCRNCGKIIDFDCPLNELISKVKKEQGFTVTKAEVYLEGYCAFCNEKENKTKRGKNDGNH